MGKRGILLAVSSLPGKYGIGDFASEALEFIKILKRNKVDVWQILPLNPVGYGHSPYQPYSSYAFDEIYISLEDLKNRGLIGHINRVESKARSNYELARKIKEKAKSKTTQSKKGNKSLAGHHILYLAQHQTGTH